MTQQGLRAAGAAGGRPLPTPIDRVKPTLKESTTPMPVVHNFRYSACRIVERGAVMRIQEEQQVNPVADEVLALTAVTRPILRGILYALKAEITADVGGHESVRLRMLPRLYRAGDGDCGICFEYAVHEAMTRGDGRVLEKINDAARLCNVPGQDTTSILFGLEKKGSQQLIATANGVLTEDSRLLYGTRGQPVKGNYVLDKARPAERS